MAQHGLVQETDNKMELYNNIFRVKEYTKDYGANEVSAIKRVVYLKGGQRSIDMVNDTKNVVLFGSSIFKGNVLAGDIDCMQFLPIIEHSKALQDIVYKILKYRFYLYKAFLGDIKCGLVTQYRSLVKYIGYYEKGIVKNYFPDIIKYGLKNSLEFNKDEKNKKIQIPSVIKTKKEMIEWLKINNEIHSLVTRRWKPEEIIQGFQLDPDGSNYSLNQACFDSDLTKVDLYFGGQPIFIECTNVLLREKKEYDVEKFKTGIILNMLTRYYVEDKKMKALKRLYALSRMEKDIDLTLKLHDFTQRSLAGKYNAINSDLSIFIYIIENYLLDFLSVDADHINVFDNLQFHITSIQEKIQKIYNPYVPYLTKLIDDINKNILNSLVDLSAREVPNSKENKKKILDQCESIKEYFDKEIDKLSIKFMKENNINFENYLIPY